MARVRLQLFSENACICASVELEVITVISPEYFVSEQSVSNVMCDARQWEDGDLWRFPVKQTEKTCIRQDPIDACAVSEAYQLCVCVCVSSVQAQNSPSLSIEEGPLFDAKFSAVKSVRGRSARSSD